MGTAPQRERSDTPDPCRGFIALGCADPTPGKEKKKEKKKDNRSRSGGVASCCGVCLAVVCGAVVCGAVVGLAGVCLAGVCLAVV